MTNQQTLFTFVVGKKSVEELVGGDVVTESRRSLLVLGSKGGRMYNQSAKNGHFMKGEEGKLFRFSL